MPEPTAARRVEQCMGTVFSIDVRTTADPTDLLDAVAGWLHWVDTTFSTYRADSAVSRLGRGEVTLAGCPPEVAEVLELCAQVSAASCGWFTAMIGGRLDPSGLVKGWAVERASRMLRAAGLADHAVNGGGDVQTAGGPAPGESWRVGVADPHRPGALATVVAGRDIAVATSGTAERGAHVVDPFTGRPATGLASITLVGAHLTAVDAYATAACAMGPAAPAWVESLPGIEAFAVTAGGERWMTRGFSAYVDTAAASVLVCGS